MVSPAALGCHHAPGMDPSNEPSTDPDADSGRLIISCLLPLEPAPKTHWDGYVPVVSIDGGAHLELIWDGSRDIELPTSPR